ncbi:hypothetical protein XO10_05860 [Marinitoga sp. 1135]|nr:hypothetical protein [Marinitoga sp. 1135]
MIINTNNDFQEEKFFKELRSMNAFYTMLKKLTSFLENKGIKYFLAYEPKFSKINPDAALKIKEKGKYILFPIEYKDSGNIENIFKNEQLNGYFSISYEKLRSAGIRITKNVEEWEFLLIIRSGNLSFEEIKNKINDIVEENENFGVFKLNYKYNNPLIKLEIFNESKYEVINEFFDKKNKFFYTPMCYFNFKMGFDAYKKENASIFFSLLVGYLFKLSWWNENKEFNIVDVLEENRSPSWEIIKASYQSGKFLRFIDKQVDEILVKSKYLKRCEEKAIKVGDIDILLNSYKINPEKNLNNPRTQKALIKTITKKLDKSYFERNYVDQLPLFQIKNSPNI